jgi:adenine-specific DNA-methyltransferase
LFSQIASGTKRKHELLLRRLFGDTLTTVEGSMQQLTERKARGAFFTPDALARFVARWAVSAAGCRILEPSCGEAAFLLAAAEELSLKGSKLNDPDQLVGIDVHETSATQARTILSQAGARASIRAGDFFLEEPNPSFDAVIGNPPFIRYQEFTGEVRARSLEAALAQGVRLSGLASSWAAFTVHASCFVKPGGRLGLVLPAELLTVGYAAEVRRFLLKRFGNVRLVVFEQRVFPEVLEDTILLLAEGKGPATHFEVYQAKNADDLSAPSIKAWTDHRPDASERWSPALLDAGAYQAFEDAVGGANIAQLVSWGSSYLGAVTGDNSFFCLTAKQMADLQLTDSDVRPISPPGARHLRGVMFSDAAWKSLVEDGKRGFLFYPSGEPSGAAWNYIRAGEARGANQAYKCKVRNPWWRIPLTKRPNFIVTYMNSEHMRFVRNEANVDILNSVYGFEIKAAVDAAAGDLLPLALLNSVTRLSAELCGRVHGGGMLKHEPRGLDELWVPSEACVLNSRDALLTLRPQIGRLLRKNDIDAVTRLVDETLLIGTAAFSRDALSIIGSARAKLVRRRMTLGGSQS